MSQAYRLTERAEADVAAIADFIAADSIDAAMKVVLALEDAFVLLASQPGVCHSREDLTDRPLRFWSVFSYLVVYDPATAPLTIIANILAALEHGAHVVVGTSGLSDADYAEVDSVARRHQRGVLAVGNFALTVV